MTTGFSGDLARSGVRFRFLGLRDRTSVGDRLGGDHLRGLDGDRLDGDRLDGERLDGERLGGDHLAGERLGDGVRLERFGERDRFR